MTSLSPPAPALRPSGAAAGVVAGLALVGCAFTPLWCSVVVFVALSAVVAFGWPRLVNLPSPRGTATVLGGTALALTLVMTASGSDHRTRWAGAVLCVGLIGSFLHQLLRQDGRPRLVMSLAGTALGLGFLGAGSYLLPAHDLVHAREGLVAVGLSVAVGVLVDAWAGATSRRLSFGALQVALGAVAGLGAVFAGAQWYVAMGVGALSGLLAWAALRTTVTQATSAHSRAQYAAGCAAALLCCFVPFAVAQIA